MSSYIYGMQPVRELLLRRADEIEQLLICRELAHSQEIIELANRAKIKIKFLPRTEIEHLVGAREHQGIAALAPLPEEQDLDEVLDKSRAKDKSLLIFLDQITDPHNLGAIIRTAECASADAVIIPEHRNARITPAVMKASSGALEWLPLCIVTNLARALEKIKQEGYWIYAAEAEARTSLWDVEFSAKSALVIGSEGKGIRPLVLKSADFQIRIPLSGKIQSLNASASAAIIIYEYQRQMMISNKK